MQRIRLGYVVRRLGMLLFTVWTSITIIFIVPRLAPGDPISAMVTRLSQQGGFVQGSAGMIEAWRQRFGLDGSMSEQYGHYLQNSATFDLGYSLSQFPVTVESLLAQAIPWTIGLLTLATLISFVLGTLIGALMGWRPTPRLVRTFLPLTLSFTSIPFYILGMLLIYLFVFTLGWFPLAGGHSTATTPAVDLDFIADVVRHGTLPALSIVLANMGSWALGMRGMMITVEGEDFLTLARAKGLAPTRIFTRYAMRNAMLPQVTHFVLSLGHIVGGTVLVEYIFGYPGVGSLLYQALVNSDFTVIQGIVYILIITTCVAVFLIDLVYPLLDPRISYEKR